MALYKIKLFKKSDYEDILTFEDRINKFLASDDFKEKFIATTEWVHPDMFIITYFSKPLQPESF